MRGLRKKMKRNNKFCSLSKKDKKDFLSMDFVERMVRVEQHVSASFGNPISYDKTECYKSLSKNEKEKFNKHLKNKKLIPIFLLMLGIIFIINLIFKVSITGRTIGDSIITSSNDKIMLITVFLFFALCLFVLISEKRKSKSVKHHVQVIDNVVLGKER